VNRPYYDEIGVEPAYDNETLLEQVYDDRDLDEEEGVVGTWQDLKDALTGDTK